jgi:PEGA domain
MRSPSRSPSLPRWSLPSGSPSSAAPHHGAARSQRLALSGAILIVALVGAAPRPAHAETGAALISGQATPRQRAVVSAVLGEELRKAGWATVMLEGADGEELAACFGAEEPWPCLQPRMSARGLARVLEIEVAPEPGPARQLRLLGQLGAAGSGRITVDSRFCRRCDDAQLAAAARLLVQRLLAGSALRDETTRLEVRTSPPGAVIRIDGRMVEAPSGSIACSPGLHTVHLQLTGYRTEFRAVLVDQGKRARVDVTLVPLPGGTTNRGEPVATIERIGLGARGQARARAGAEARAIAEAEPMAPDDDPPPSSAAASPAADPRGARAADHRALGWALTVSGGVLFAVGTALFALDEDASRDPTRRHRPRYFDSAPAGLTLAAVGGATAATGLYLLLSAPSLSRAESRAASPPAAAVIGYAGTF